MRVFVTGHKGYIGTHLVDLLKQSGHHVTGCDLGLFDGCEWEERTAPDREIVKDVRDLTIDDLTAHDCLMHLAALSNDPMGELDPVITSRVNRDASIQLAEMAKAAGVERYLFSGSCSVYGTSGGDGEVSEESPLCPLTAYARSKIETEQAVSLLADDSFTPVFLRNATAYGHSPMLRIDLVANNLLCAAYSLGQIRIMSDGTPWRPLIHCRDIARAFLAFMTAPRDVVRNKAVNVGAASENYQVKDIADAVQRLIPEANVVYTGEIGNDPRSYRVNFDLLKSLLPEFRLEYSLATGLEELHRKLVERGFSSNDFSGDKFVRMRTLARRRERLGIHTKAQGDSG